MYHHCRYAGISTYNTCALTEALTVRVLAVCILLLGQSIIAELSAAQQNNSDENSQTAFCDFDDGQEISIRYNGSIKNSKDEPHNGRVWLPGGTPMTLFTGAPVTLNNSTIPAGAYSVYVLPNKKEWTLIVNKNVTAGAAYDEHQDVARSPMELGEVDTPPRELQVSFAHSGPKTCSIRLYYAKVGAFTDFKEK
jgi:Protein of unknown function (DUF2911)